jgi:hypothetical protein
MASVKSARASSYFSWAAQALPRLENVPKNLGSRRIASL